MVDDLPHTAIPIEYQEAGLYIPESARAKDDAELLQRKAQILDLVEGIRSLPSLAHDLIKEHLITGFWPDGPGYDGRIGNNSAIDTIRLCLDARSRDYNHDLERWETRVRRSTFNYLLHWSLAFRAGVFEKVARITFDILEMRGPEDEFYVWEDVLPLLFPGQEPVVEYADYVSDPDFKPLWIIPGTDWDTPIPPKPSSDLPPLPSSHSEKQLNISFKNMKIA